MKRFLISLLICGLLTICFGLIYAQDKLEVTGDLEISSPAAGEQSGLILRPQSEPAPIDSSPGQIYYDDTDNQLYYYDGGGWEPFGQDKNVATRIVAASNSLDQSRANWTCDGIDDQHEINMAINSLPASGGVVYLLEGTYNISAVISPGEPSAGIAPHTNTAIIGTGAGTVLRVVAGSNNINVIAAFNVNRILISQLRIDGNSRTGSNNNGIMFLSVTQSKIDQVWAENMSTAGIYLSASSNNTVSGNHSELNTIGIYLEDNSLNNTISGNNCQANTSGGIVFWAFANNNTISGNNCQANNEKGIYIYWSSNNTISGNNCQANNGDGIFMFNSSNNSISGNNIQANGFSGIIINTNSSRNILFGNNIHSNLQEGIYVSGGSSNNTISGNIVWSNGGANQYDGIKIDSNSDNNLVSSNPLYDSAGTGFPININSTDCDNSYLVGNLISSWPSNRTIRDVGTNTRYTDRIKMTLERAAVLTVSGATITPPSPTSYLPVRSSSGQVNVTTITATDRPIGDLLILEGTNTTNNVNIQDTGNVRLSCDAPPCAGSRSRTLHLDDVLTLIWNGTNWVELHWADNN